MTTRGEQAREEIVDEALRIASVEGLEGLSLGSLAKQLNRSKSGLFSHFESKEALQIAILESAAEHIVEAVVLPALEEPRGLARLTAIFRNWGRWAREGAQLPGGCVFVTASVEYDDRPGPVRDVVVSLQKRWLETIERAAAIAIEEGDLSSEVDPAQLAFELFAVMQGSYQYYRLFRDPLTLERARSAYDAIIERSRPNNASESPDS